MKAFDMAQAGLLNTPRFRKAPGFDTVRSLMKGLQIRETIPVIHVVGTNGKGSVSVMIAKILEAHGRQVGLFTSPHLTDVRERMTVDGRQMSETDFVRYYEWLKAAIDDHLVAGGERATFFEQVFLMAMMHFEEKQVDVMVMEAGIGGRHDTTNVLENRLLNVITLVGMDHIGILGDSLEAIAEEKAGIIRKGIPTVYMKQSDPVNRIIEGICEKKGSKAAAADPEAVRLLARSEEGIDFSVHTKYYSYEELFIPSKARYQLANSRLALEAVHQLADWLKPDAGHVAEGLKNFNWPGRLTYIRPDCLIDGAHNPQGLRAVADHLNTVEAGRPVQVVFCTMADKDLQGLVQACLSIKALQSVYLPELPYERAADPEKLSELFIEKGFRQIHRPGPVAEFISTNRLSESGQTLTVYLGSLYLTAFLQ